MAPLIFRKRRSGFTLIEMLIGVAVVGVVLAMAIPSLTGMIERRRVVAAAGEIASIFAQARAESAAAADKISLHLEPVPTGVGDWSCIRLSSHSVTDYCACNRDPSEVCSSTDVFGKARLLREYLLPRSTSVHFDANAAAEWGEYEYRLTFDRGSFPAGVKNVFVAVTGVRTGALLHVEYNSAGRVRTCSPDGSMGGFPLCG